MSSSQCLFIVYNCCCCRSNHALYRYINLVFRELYLDNILKALDSQKYSAELPDAKPDVTFLPFGTHSTIKNYFIGFYKMYDGPFGRQSDPGFF